MPNFVRSILLWVTGYGWLALLAGLGLLGYAGYAQYKASGDHAYVAREKLQSISGKVETASEVTVTSKRRRGGSRVSDRYYEIAVKPTAGSEAQKLRIALSVGRSKVQDIIDEQITALYDPDDNNIAYDIQMGSQPVLDYETTKGRLLAQAESSARFTSGWANLAGSFLLAVVGAIAMALNRRLRRSAAAAAA